MVDHKAIKSVEIGADLILDLYTYQAEQVIFQNSNETDWTVLWEKDGVINKKGHLKKRDNKLILSRVTASSAGTYKILDSEGLALSTVKVKVTGRIYIFLLLFFKAEFYVKILKIEF
uniref:Galectin 17 n=1 Tax=Cyprinus carpio TaxID=7962 RepID=A0A8C1VGT6_CYPCA